jgi:hypothetical protein
VTERATAMLSVNHPEIVPVRILDRANINKSLPDMVRTLSRVATAMPDQLSGPGVPGAVEES